MQVLTQDLIPEVLTDIKDTLQHTRSMSSFSKDTGINRVNLYGLLKNQHKPSCDKFLTILNAAGYDVILSKRNV